MPVLPRRPYTARTSVVLSGSSRDAQRISPPRAKPRLCHASTTWQAPSTPFPASLAPQRVASFGSSKRPDLGVSTRSVSGFCCSAEVPDRWHAPEIFPQPGIVLLTSPMPLSVRHLPVVADPLLLPQKQAVAPRDLVGLRAAPGDQIHDSAVALHFGWRREPNRVGAALANRGFLGAAGHLQGAQRGTESLGRRRGRWRLQRFGGYRRLGGRLRGWILIQQGQRLGQLHLGAHAVGHVFFSPQVGAV